MGKEEMKFIKKSILFMLVFIILTSLIIALPSYIFVSAKEHFTINNVVSLQNKEPTLYGMVYSDQTSLYKLELVNSRDCKIMALGSSRVLQFRDHFFTKQFCNAGGSVYNIKDFETFLVNAENKPEVLIIGLDQNFFSSEWSFTKQSFEEENTLAIFLTQIFKIYSDYFKGKINLNQLEYPPNDKIGLNAIIKNSGFKNDGSRFGVRQVENKSVQEMVEGELRNIANSKGRFVQDAKFSEESLKDLDSFLNYCQQNHIQVIGFLPPFSKEVWQDIKKRRTNYEYMFELEDKIVPIFEKYNFEFYDFTDLNIVRASNCEVLDGFHASEKAHLRILINMVEKDSFLKDYTSLNYLKEKLEFSTGCFLTAE